MVKQQYVPDDLVEADYYQPSDHDAERAVSERLPRLRRIVRGLAGPAPGSSEETPAAGRGGPVAYSAESARDESTVGSSAGDPSPTGSAPDAAVASVATPDSAADSAPGGAGRGGDSGAAAGKDQT